MATERQVEANRRNARKSTGPSSQAGRRRAARNALTHGLSIFHDDTAEINELALEIAGPTQDFEVIEVSSIIAAAEIELRRIRRVRLSLFEAAGISALMEQFPERSSGRLSIANSILDDLQGIQRYERHAITRRDKALRRLLWLQQSERKA
jgi:hypothetical protein